MLAARRVVVTGLGCWRGYCGGMRYPDGGGLSAAGRARREKLRLQAAEWFAVEVTPPEVARRLRVSCNSAFAVAAQLDVIARMCRGY